jgi:hypothetical protein
MRVVETEEGFAFLFDLSEKSLGVSILEGFKSDRQDVKDQITEAKLVIVFAGVKGSQTVN